MVYERKPAGAPQTLGPRVVEVSDDEAERIKAHRWATGDETGRNHFDAEAAAASRQRVHSSAGFVGTRRFSAGPDLGTWEVEEKKPDENGHYFNVKAAPHIQKVVDDMCRSLEGNSRYKVGPMGPNSPKREKTTDRHGARSADFSCFAVRAIITLAPAVAFVVAMAFSSNMHAEGHGVLSERRTNSKGSDWFSRWRSSIKPGFHIPGLCGVTSQPLMVAACPLFVLSIFMRTAVGWGDLRGWQQFVYAMFDNGGILLAVLAAVEYPLPGLILNPLTFPGFVLYLISVGMKELGWGDYFVDKDGQITKHKRRLWCWLADSGAGIFITLGFAEWYAPGLIDDWLLVLGVAALLIAHGIRDCTETGASTQTRRLACKLADLLGWFLPLVAAIDYCLPGVAEEPFIISGGMSLMTGVATRELGQGVSSRIGACCELVTTCSFGLGQLLLAMVAVDRGIGDVYDIHLLELALAAAVAVGLSWLALVDGDETAATQEGQFRPNEASGAEVTANDAEPTGLEKAVGLWPAVFISTSLLLSWGVASGI